MKSSTEIKKLIKTWEGCSLRAYICPAGRLTIGYGHTGSDVSPGMKITQQTADELFESDIARFEAELQRWMQIDHVKPLTQNQYDALVSFAYNVGTVALRRSTLWKKVCANPSDSDIADEFRKWVHAKGKVLPGLVKRRATEANIYTTGNYERP